MGGGEEGKGSAVGPLVGLGGKWGRSWWAVRCGGGGASVRKRKPHRHLWDIDDRHVLACLEVHKVSVHFAAVALLERDVDCERGELALFRGAEHLEGASEEEALRLGAWGSEEGGGRKRGGEAGASGLHRQRQRRAHLCDSIVDVDACAREAFEADPRRSALAHQVGHVQR